MPRRPSLLSSSFAALRHKLYSGEARKRTPPPKPRLHVEHLEDRITPSVTVTTTLDPTTPIAGQLSLREAIAEVNAGQVADNTIILPAGAYQNTQGALFITHSLTLQGAGAGSTILDGRAVDRVVLIDPTTAVNVQINGVTIRNGQTEAFGGGIDVQDAQGQSSLLTLNNCIVSGNEAGQGGGGIHSLNGDIVLNNCQIVSNKADTLEGGGVLLGNGGTDNLTVSNSTIAGNRAAQGGGGIALLDSNAGGGNLMIQGSTIADNIVTTNTLFGGGGILVESAGNALGITNTILSDNLSQGDGGGFEKILTRSDLITPIPPITFTNDTLTGNVSNLGNGGGIAILDAAAVTLQGCTVSDNTAGQSGGGFNDSGNGNVAFTASSIRGNQSNGGTGGGGIDYTGTGAVHIAQSIVDGNFANNALTTGGGGGLEIDNAAAIGSIVNSLFSDNTADAAGGGVDVFSGLTLTATGSTFVGNRTLVNFGGGLNIATSGTNAAGTASSLIDDTIVGNFTILVGGGLEDLAAGGLNLTDDTISANFSGGGGGGVGVNFGTAVFLDTIDAGNFSQLPSGNAGDLIVSISSSVASKGGNLIGDGTAGGFTLFPAGFPNANGDLVGTLANPINPLLGPLQNNGGIFAGAPDDQQIVPTELLLPGSPAFGKGVADGVTTDERGFPRLTPPDIGAVQFENVALTVSINPASPTVNLNGTATLAFQITNVSGNTLPADNSTLTVTLPARLTVPAGTPLTFSLGTLAADQSETFTLTVTATQLGPQVISAVVASIDTTPATIPATATITGVQPPPITNPITNPPTMTGGTTAMHMPVGALSLFGFGFGPGLQLDLFEVDNQGEVFAVPFGGTNSTPTFLSPDIVFANLRLMNGTIVGDLTTTSNQMLFTEILNFNNPFVFQALLKAITTHS